MPAPKSQLAKGGRKDLASKSGDRPWNMNTTYEPSLCKDITELMGAGYSIYQVAKRFGVAVSTLYRWAEAFSDFKEAIEAGKDYRRAWLDKGFQDYMEEKFCIKGYTVALTADYHYNDKTPQIHIDMTKGDEETMKKVNDLIEDLHKTTI